MYPTRNFENDVFISYAHIDDLPPTEGLSKWVEELEKRLRTRLKQLLGKEVEVWRDPKLSGNDYFADTLVVKLANAAVLLSVLSPRYVESEWCLRELNEFYRLASQHGGVRVGNKGRIFKVVKTYIPRERYPPQLEGMLTYEFYDYDEVRGRAREFSPEVRPAPDSRYWDKLEDLAQDLTELLRRLHADGAPRTPAAAPSGKTVYLAETTSDLSGERDKIKREMEQHGHLVLPDGELPLRPNAFRQAVSDCLGRSHLAVHMIGSNYGIVPEGEQHSVVQLQHELSAARGESLPRIIWLPNELQTQDSRQLQFVSELQLLNVHDKVELLQAKLEDLKTQIHKSLAGGEERRAEGAPPLVYLVCDREDVGEVGRVEDQLNDSGMETILLPTSADAQVAAPTHKELLQQCDAVLVYFNRAQDTWLHTMKFELIKMDGYERAQPLLAPKTFYLTGEATDGKERFKMHGALVIRHYGEFAGDSLWPFLSQLKKRSEQQ